MDVICIDEPAFYELIRKVVKKLSEEKPEKENLWIDGTEAMAFLNCGKTKLQELRNNGEIVYSQPSRKIILYHKPSLAEYLSKHIKDKF